MLCDVDLVYPAAAAPAAVVYVRCGLELCWCPDLAVARVELNVYVRSNRIGIELQEENVELARASTVEFYDTCQQPFAYPEIGNSC